MLPKTLQAASGRRACRPALLDAQHVFANAPPPAGDKWPARTGMMQSWFGPDVLVLAFQEIANLNAVNVVAGGGADNPRAWDTAIGCALNQQPLPEAYVAAQVCSRLLLSASGAAALSMHLAWQQPVGLCMCVSSPF